MAAGEVSEKEVEKAVKICNKELKAVGKGLKLNETDTLKETSKALAESWQTENGEKSIKGLNNIIQKLQTSTNNLEKAIQNVQKQEYRFSKKEEFKRTESIN